MGYAGATYLVQEVCNALFDALFHILPLATDLDRVEATPSRLRRRSCPGTRMRRRCSTSCVEAQPVLVRISAAKRLRDAPSATRAQAGEDRVTRARRVRGRADGGPGRMSARRTIVVAPPSGSPARSREVRHVDAIAIEPSAAAREKQRIPRSCSLACFAIFLVRRRGGASVARWRPAPRGRTAAQVRFSARPRRSPTRSPVRLHGLSRTTIRPALPGGSDRRGGFATAMSRRAGGARQRPKGHASEVRRMASIARDDRVARRG